MAAGRRTNPKLSHRTYESLFEHATLLEFSRVINGTLDLRFILSHVLLTIMGKILAAKGMVLLLHQAPIFRVEMIKGYPEELNEAEVAIRKLPRNSLGIERLSPRQYPWVRFFRQHDVSLLLPLCVADQPVGLLAFGPRLTKKRLRSQEITYLRALADLSATAIEKAHTIVELEVVNRKLDGKIQELNTLFDFGRELGTLLDPDKIVRLLMLSLMGQIGVRRYLVCLRKGADVHVVASRLDEAAPQGELLKTLFGQRTAVTVDDFVVRHRTDPREALRALGLSVIIPMQLQGENRGLILLGEKLSKEPFTPTDLEFLTSVGNLAIISLENARLFKDAIERQRLEEELKIAREIQKQLLPSTLPHIPGIEIAATNVSSKQVGGDYYDVIALDAERHIIAIGDVSGKGTPAALLMANLQATIRALVPLGLGLSELTGRVNDLMCQNTGGNKFVTFFWGILDGRHRTLTYVNAGHNYPILLRNGGSVEHLDRGGMILGILPTSIPYEEASVAFGGGDVLALYTDGVSEAMNKEGVEYGEKALESTLHGCLSCSAEGIIRTIHEDVIRHAGGAQQSDDITMMIVRFLP